MCNELIALNIIPINDLKVIYEYLYQHGDTKLKRKYEKYSSLMR